MFVPGRDVQPHQAVRSGEQLRCRVDRVLRDSGRSDPSQLHVRASCRPVLRAWVIDVLMMRPHDVEVSCRRRHELLGRPHRSPSCEGGGAGQTWRSATPSYR